jgi:quercetin dioxygenase-like cupin family protein
MEIKRIASELSVKGPAEYFTGDLQAQQAEAPASNKRPSDAAGVFPSFGPVDRSLQELAGGPRLFFSSLKGEIFSTLRARFRQVFMNIPEGTTAEVFPPYIGLHQQQKLNMEIKRSGSQPSSKGPADWFTGTVRIDPLFQANTPARAAGASVTFEPGARTAWHIHPLGQTLIVTAGCGWVQREGGRIEEIHPGDVVWFPPAEKHWHGATPTTAMTHMAIQENLNGKVVEWMEKVTDDQYRK